MSTLPPPPPVPQGRRDHDRPDDRYPNHGYENVAPTTYVPTQQLPVAIYADPDGLHQTPDPGFDLGANTGQWDHKQIKFAFTSGEPFNGPVDAANKAIIEPFAVWNLAASRLVETTRCGRHQGRLGHVQRQLDQTVQVYQSATGSPNDQATRAFVNEWRRISVHDRPDDRGLRRQHRNAASGPNKAARSDSGQTRTRYR